MKYMVMECQLSYAVVLDETGRFLKVANRNYKVGQMVTDVIEMQLPKNSSVNKSLTWMYSLAAVAACLIFVVVSFFQMNRMTYASVYMKINPEIRIDVNKRDMVVGLHGVNEDGMRLLLDYNFRNKSLDLVVDELVERAIEQKYLKEGGQISLALEAKNETWVAEHKETLQGHVQNYLSEKISATIEITEHNKPEQGGDSIYGDTDYEIRPSKGSEESNSTYGVTDYKDGISDFDVAESFEDLDSKYDGDTPYDESDKSDGDTPYADTLYDEPEKTDDDTPYDEADKPDGDTAYDEPDRPDGDTPYDNPDKPDDDTPYGEADKSDDDTPYDESDKSDDDTPYDEPDKPDGDTPYDEPDKLDDDTPYDEPGRPDGDTPYDKPDRPDDDTPYGERD